MKIDGTVITKAQQEAASNAMTGSFVSRDIEAALERAGVDGPYVRMRGADRLLQNARKAGLIKFAAGKWSPVTVDAA